MCNGLAGAVRSLQCGEADVADVFMEDELELLYEACPTDEARCVAVGRVGHVPPPLPTTLSLIHI